MNDIVSKNDFDLLTGEEKLDLLLSYKGKFKRKDIAKKWGVKPQFINDLVFRLKKNHTNEEYKFKYSVKKELSVDALNDLIDKTCKIITGNTMFHFVLEIQPFISIKSETSVDCNAMKECILPTLKLLNKQKKYTVNLSINDI